jgi:hypothetical protein
MLAEAIKAGAEIDEAMTSAMRPERAVKKEKP